MTLPSGRLIRGRGLRDPAPAGPDPDFGLYLLQSKPEDVSWPFEWVDCLDLMPPADPAAARRAFTEAWRRSAAERVEVACMGGVGRTGTALACIAVLDGIAPEDAVDYVRQHYYRLAVETVYQRRYIAAFS
jgi:protein-tyrosine phosphatase